MNATKKAGSGAGPPAFCSTLDGPCRIEAELSASEPNASTADADGAVPCSACALLAAQHGLAVALQMRLSEPDVMPCELELQPGAALGLSDEEQAVLLHVAEAAVVQALREGSIRVRVTLRCFRLDSVDLTVAGEGKVCVDAEVAASFRKLVLIRRLAARIGGRIIVRRLADGSLFVRCGTRWPDGDTGRWVLRR